MQESILNFYRISLPPPPPTHTLTTYKLHRELIRETVEWISYDNLRGTMFVLPATSSCKTSIFLFLQILPSSVDFLWRSEASISDSSSSFLNLLKSKLQLSVPSVAQSFDCSRLLATVEKMCQGNPPQKVIS